MDPAKIGTHKKHFSKMRERARPIEDDGGGWGGRGERFGGIADDDVGFIVEFF